MRNVTKFAAAGSVVVAIAVTGCAPAAARTDHHGTPPSSSGRKIAGNDLGLIEAANKADAIIHSKYEPWYAGMVLDHDAGTMTIYRKPGSDLDQAVRRQVGKEVIVNFKGAELSGLRCKTL